MAGHYKCNLKINTEKMWYLSWVGLKGINSHAIVERTIGRIHRNKMLLHLKK